MAKKTAKEPRPAGRPPKPPGEAKHTALSLRLNLEEVAAIGQAAAAKGLSVREWCRETILRAAKRQHRSS